MKTAAASRRSESYTPRVTPQDPCNCGCEDGGETWMKLEPERLNDPVRSPDVAHPGGEEHPAIHKQIKPQYAAVLTAGGRALTPTRIGRAKQLQTTGEGRQGTGGAPHAVRNTTELHHRGTCSINDPWY